MPSLNEKPCGKTEPSRDSIDHRIPELIRGSSTAFLLRILGAAAAVGVQIYVARTIGKEGFGDYSYALAISGVLAIVARVGLGTSLRRFIPQYQLNQNPGLLAGLLTVSFLAVTALSGTISLVGIWVVKTWGTGLPGGQFDAILAAAWLLPPLALMGAVQAILIGFKSIGPAIWAVQILRPGLLVILLFMLCTWFALPPVAVTAIRADTIALSLVVLVLSIFVISTSRGKTHWNRPKFETREWLTVSLPLMLITGLQVLFNQTDIIMLGSLTSSSETGIYAAAARIARLVIFGITAINAAVAPMISELYHSGRINKMQSVMDFSSKILLIFTGIIVIIFVFFGKTILGLFGPAFSKAWGIMMILVAGQAINSLSGPVAYFLTMTGHQNIAARIVIICAVVNIVLNAMFIPLWGITGAAIATTVSVAAWNIWMLVSTRKLLGINPSAFRKWIK